MIHVFHGFLGSPRDFSFLEGEDVILHDLYEITELPRVTEEDTLIGYSMGGRICLEVASKNNYQVRRIVLINSHPGLESDLERKERTVFEAMVLDKLNSGREDFLAWWNSLSIFKSDLPIEVSDKRYEKSRELFEKFALSKQTNFLPEIIQHKDKVLWIIGMEDEKYLELASDVLLPHDLKIKTIPGGHRLFQRTQELKEVLTEEGIL